MRFSKKSHIFRQFGALQLMMNRASVYCRGTVKVCAFSRGAIQHQGLWNTGRSVNRYLHSRNYHAIFRYAGFDFNPDHFFIRRGRVQPSEELIPLNVFRSLRTHNGLKFNTIHEIFSIMLRSAGITRNAKTHVCRKVAVLLAESRGLSESQIRNMGKWGTRSDALTGT